MARLDKPSFTKSDLIEELNKKYKNLTRAKAKTVVNCIFNSMINALANRKRVEIRGFGSFGLRSYEARMGKNPQTGESFQVKAKNLPFFKVGKLKAEIKLDKKV